MLISLNLRCLSDNSNLAEELLKGFQQRTTSGKACIEVDLRKAFDSVKWAAIETTLRDMGFSRKFVSLSIRLMR